MQITVYAELSQSYASQHPNYVANIAYLLKPGASQNELKPDKTSRSQPKQPQKNNKTTRNDTKFQNWGNLEFSTSFPFSNFEPKYPNLRILGQKVLTF